MVGGRPGPNLPPAATTTEQPRVSPAAVSPRPGSPPSLPRAGPSPRSLRGTRTLQRSRLFERAALAGRQGGAGARALARGLNRSTADCGRARDDGPTTPELSLSNARQPELRLSDATMALGTCTDRGLQDRRTGPGFRRANRGHAIHSLADREGTGDERAGRRGRRAAVVRRVPGDQERDGRAGGREASRRAGWRLVGRAGQGVSTATRSKAKGGTAR